MPFVLVNSTETLPVNLNGKEQQSKNHSGQSPNTEYSITSSIVSNNVLVIILLTMATMFLIALFVFCYSCCLRRKVLMRKRNLTEEPNAPGRQQLQDALDFQRTTLMPQKEPVGLDFSIFQSESSSFRGSLSRWASIRNLPTLHASESSALKKDKPVTSYATTPRSVFPPLSKNWGESSAKRIEHLRTKLVARFPTMSSRSSSDISVFFSASSRNSEWGECSQLSSDEERTVSSKIATDKRKSKSNSYNKRVPSIVIEFVN